MTSATANAPLARVATDSDKVAAITSSTASRILDAETITATSTASRASRTAVVLARSSRRQCGRRGASRARAMAKVSEMRETASKIP